MNAQPSISPPRVTRHASLVTAKGDKLFLLLALALAAIIYYPLTKCYFFSDDFLHLYWIINRDLIQNLLQPYGGHLCIVRNTIFYLFHRLFGVRAELYYWAVFATHLVNVSLLFQIIRRLTGSSPLGAFGAALWGTCADHAGTLAWYSVYGQVVAATLLLCILLQAVRAVSDGRPLPRAVVLLWPLGLVVASTCFGVGIGATAVAPIAFFLLLPPSRQRTRSTIVLALVALTLPFMYRGELRLYEWVSGPSPEVFGAGILVAALYSWQTWRSIFTMTGALLSYGVTSLVLGFSNVGVKFPGLAAYVITGGCLLALAATFIWSPSIIRRQVCAFLVLALGIYGIIAAGRAGLLGSNSSWGAAQGRYHYVGTIPLAIVLCLMLARMAGRQRVAALGRWVMLPLWVGLTLFAYSSSPPFDLNVSSRRETAQLLDTVRAAVAAAPPGGEVYIPNRPFRSGWILPTDRSFPGWAGVFTIFFPSNIVDGRRVYFVVDDPEVLAAARAGKRTADLVVEPSPPD